MAGEVRLTFDPDGRPVFVPVRFSLHVEEVGGILQSLNAEEDDEGGLPEFWVSMFGDEGRTSSVPSSPVARRRFTHERTREEKGKFLASTAVELGSRGCDRSQDLSLTASPVTASMLPHIISAPVELCSRPEVEKRKRTLPETRGPREKIQFSSQEKKMTGRAWASRRGLQVTCVGGGSGSTSPVEKSVERSSRSGDGCIRVPVEPGSRVVNSVAHVESVDDRGISHRSPKPRTADRGWSRRPAYLSLELVKNVRSPCPLFSCIRCVAMRMELHGGSAFVSEVERGSLPTSTLEIELGSLPAPVTGMGIVPTMVERRSHAAVTAIHPRQCSLLCRTDGQGKAQILESGEDCATEGGGLRSATLVLLEEDTATNHQVFAGPTKMKATVELGSRREPRSAPRRSAHEVPREGGADDEQQTGMVRSNKLVERGSQRTDAVPPVERSSRGYLSELTVQAHLPALQMITGDCVIDRQRARPSRPQQHVNETIQGLYGTMIGLAEQWKRKDSRTENSLSLSRGEVQLVQNSVRDQVADGGFLNGGQHGLVTNVLCGVISESSDLDSVADILRKSDLEAHLILEPSVDPMIICNVDSALPPVNRQLAVEQSGSSTAEEAIGEATD